MMRDILFTVGHAVFDASIGGIELHIGGVGLRDAQDLRVYRFYEILELFHILL